MLDNTSTNLADFLVFKAFEKYLSEMDYIEQKSSLYSCLSVNNIYEQSRDSLPSELKAKVNQNPEIELHRIAEHYKLLPLIMNTPSFIRLFDTEGQAIPNADCKEVWVLGKDVTTIEVVRENQYYPIIHTKDGGKYYAHNSYTPFFYIDEFVTNLINKVEIMRNQ